ncbi:MAG: hypothetical protein ACP5I1_12680 [Candidatus Hinthialibacter sp.]
MKTMRNATLLAAGVFGILMAAPQTWAQEDNDTTVKFEKQIKTQVERMTKRYDLNTEQQKQIEDILKSGVKDVEELQERRLNRGERGRVGQSMGLRDGCGPQADQQRQERRLNRGERGRVGQAMGLRDGRGPQMDQQCQVRGLNRGDRGRSGPAMRPRDGRGPQADQQRQERRLNRGERGRVGQAMGLRDGRGPRFGVDAQGRKQDPNGAGFGREPRVRGFQRELDLTDEQAAKLRDLLK